MTERLTQVALALGLSDDVSMAAKATAILIVGLAAVRLARRPSASVRHLALAATFGGVLLLPLALLVAPEVPAISVPTVSVVDPDAIAIAESSDTPAGRPVAATSRAATRTAASPGWSAQAMARTAWGIGALIAIASLGRALWRLARLRRASVPWLNGRPWVATLSAEADVRRHVEVLIHEEVAAPLAVGLWHPAILLPADVSDWKDADIRRALLHELEHVRRGDWTVQLVARVVCAMHWFNPFAWIAWRQLSLEAERACDDAVVTRAEGTDYAEQLVLLAQRLIETHSQPALAMARRSDLSVRVSAILDAAQRRGRAGVPAALAVVACVFVVVAALAPLRAVSAAASNESARFEIREGNVTGPAVVGRDQSIRAARTGKAERGRRPRALDRALYEAAESGDLAEVTELIDAGADVDAAIDGDGSPLIGAAREGKVNVVRVLLDRGADVDMPVPGDGTPLIMAAREGHSGVVAMLLDRGASIDLVVPEDENALIQASANGRLEVVQLLIRRGADVNARAWAERAYERPDGEWRTPLGMARRGRHAAVERALVAAGAHD